MVWERVKAALVVEFEQYCRMGGECNDSFSLSYDKFVHIEVYGKTFTYEKHLCAVR